MTRGRENRACSITETGKRADLVRMLPSHHSSDSPPNPEAAGKSEIDNLYPVVASRRESKRANAHRDWSRLVIEVNGSSVESRVMSGSSRATGRRRVQYAALPFRLDGKTRTEVMLVTSRETRRWIIPKGWPHKGKAPHDSAAREAFEEAGVVGAVGKRTVGSFPYQKRLKNGGVTVCEVHVSH